jgi:Protein of unknown function (DUF2867)
MPRISAREFLDLPLRVHSFLKDVPLHDVWAVDLPSGFEGITLCEFRSRVKNQSQRNTIPNTTKALLGLRFALGRIFRLDAQTSAQKLASYVRFLPQDDRDRSLVPPGSKESVFDVVYSFENEMLLELVNATVHAFWAQALTRVLDGYRLYWAIYVKPVGWITRTYMALIDPLRRWVVYPQLLSSTRQDWLRLYSGQAASCT